MTFSAPFSRVITKPFGGVPATSSAWWLSGGIAAANCIVAYTAKGAGSYALSKVNLANPGTYDLADGATYPTWNTATGWGFSSTKVLTSNFTAKGTNKAYSIIARIDELIDDITSNTYFGTQGSSLDSLNLIRGFSTQKLQWNSSGYFIKADATKSGNVVMAISGNNPYLDGNDLGTISNANAIANDGLRVGSSGTFTFVAGAIYDTAITPTQVGLLTTALYAL